MLDTLTFAIVAAILVGPFAVAYIVPLALGWWGRHAILDLRECDIIETPVNPSTNVVRLDDRRRA